MAAMAKAEASDLSLERLILPPKAYFPEQSPKGAIFPYDEGKTTIVQR
jgi:hypothetical protein